MKSIPFVFCLSFFGLIAGCGDPSTVSGDSTASEETSAAESTEPSSAETSPAGEETASDAETMGRKIDLTPENTSIAFVGLHTNPDKPDPRNGSFEKLSGTAMVDQTLMSVQVDIDTTSLTTEIEKLTNHLKSPDFFDVNRFPKASFESTKILDKEDGTVEITGDLTLLGKTNSVTFPATVSTDGDLKLEAKFKIDRTKWGMDFGTDNVEKMVDMTIKIGK